MLIEKVYKTYPESPADIPCIGPGRQGLLAEKICVH